jgi:D-beta-D-heptose 7-phosphate kinase/D-beta-D-heptose 1-phosphate adenosyltransferase
MAEKLKAEVVSRTSLQKLVKKLKKEGKSICLVAGSWDLIHVGHARFITKAKSLADVLIVAAPSNKAVRTLKGYGRPIIDEKARAQMVSYLLAPDYVLIYPETTIYKTLQLLKPDYFFTVAEEWNQVAKSPEAKLVASYGGLVVRSDRQSPFISASKIIDRVAGEKVKKLFEACLKVAQEVRILAEQEKEEETKDYYSHQIQKDARFAGVYDEVLKNVKKCVFCDLKDKYIIKKGKHCVLTVALFPYIDGQLMVVPYRHMESVLEMTEKENAELRELTNLGIGLLREKMGISDVWQIFREGKQAQKTVGHIHLILMPFRNELLSWHYQKVSLEPIKLAEKLREGLVKNG